MFIKRSLLTLPLLIACTSAPPPKVEPDALLAPRWLEGETFGETYTAVADLSDGTYVQLQLAVTNVGPGDRKGACRALVVSGEQRWTGATKVDEGGWRYEPATRTLIMGPCHAKETARSLELTAVTEGARVTLVLEAAPRPVRPPDGHIEVDEAFYDSEILVPFAPARASLKLPGQAPKALEGWGFSDHSRATTLPADLAWRWVRVRALGPKGRLLVARYPPEAKAPVGWSWEAGEAGPKPLEAFTLEARAGIREGGAWRVGLGPRQVNSKALLFRHAPVEEQGWLSGVIRAVIGNPVTYTYRTGEGLMEVTIVDE